MTSTNKQNARWQRHWDKKSHSYDREMRFFDRHLFRDSRAWACGQATGDVLEVAIGTGLNLDAYPAGIALTGLDFSEQMLDIARTRAAELGRSPTLVHGDAQAMPFDNDSFDTTVCTFGLCAIPDVNAAVAELTRVLRPENSSSLTTSKARHGSAVACNAYSKSSPCHSAASTSSADRSTKSA